MDTVRFQAYSVDLEAWILGEPSEKLIAVAKIQTVLGNALFEISRYHDTKGIAELQGDPLDPTEAFQKLY